MEALLILPVAIAMWAFGVWCWVRRCWTRRSPPGECLFVSGPQKDVDELYSHWQIMPPERMVDELNSATNVSSTSGQRRDFDTERLAEALGRGQSRIVVEKRLPIRFALLDEQAASNLRETVQQHSRIN